MKRPRALDLAELHRHPLPSVEDGDKDAHGRLLIIAGSRAVPGAALLAAHAAMRAGAGKLRMAVPDDVAVPLGIAMPEAMVKGFATARDGGFTRRAAAEVAELAADSDAIVAGPGMRDNRGSARLAESLCALNRPIALDAAMLHVLPRASEDARAARIAPILLPHKGEMASLLGCEEQAVEDDPLGCGRRCAELYGAVVLVKGVQSLVVAPDGAAWKFTGGASGLGVSGSGDTLAGIVGGLLARGADPLTALLWSVWLHGEAGRLLSEKVGPVGFLAREIPGEVPALLHRSGL
jgi:ADP-dependent NAD(P)H-hydrate dehydratase